MTGGIEQLFQQGSGGCSDSWTVMSIMATAGSSLAQAKATHSQSHGTVVQMSDHQQ